MTLELLEPRTEPRWSAHSPQGPAPTTARPAPLALPPERRAPAAHAPPSPAWAAPLSSRIAEAREARALYVLARCALDQLDESRVLARGFAGSAVARMIRRDETEGWALGRFSARDVEAAVLATLDAVEIAQQRALDCDPDPATTLITRELAFGLLRALGTPDSVAGAHARDAVLEILITPN